MRGHKDLLPAAVLTAFPLILYAPLLLGKKVLYWGVYLLQFYPWRQLTRRLEDSPGKLPSQRLVHDHTQRVEVRLGGGFLAVLLFW